MTIELMEQVEDLIQGHYHVVHDEHLIADARELQTAALIKKAEQQDLDEINF